MKYSQKELEEAVKNSKSYRDVLRYLNIRLTGGSQSHWKRQIVKLGIDTSHFLGRSSSRGKISSNKRPPADVLKLRTSGTRECSKRLRRSLIEMGVEYICSNCGQKPIWLGNPLTLDVDHINENWLDDRIDNLRFLCPNCHSQFSRNLLPR